MSLLTAQPTGTVVFVQLNHYAEPPAPHVVEVVRRADIYRVEFGEYYSIVVRYGDGRVLKISVRCPDGDEPKHIKQSRAQREIFDSITAEDGDVVWTELGNNYTRTPDKKEVRR